MLKFVVFLLALAACQTTKNAHVPSCEAVMKQWDIEHQSKGHVFRGMEEIAAGTIIAVYLDLAEGVGHGLIIAGPDALAPQPDSKIFKFKTFCEIEGTRALVFEGVTQPEGETASTEKPH